MREAVGWCLMLYLCHHRPIDRAEVPFPTDLGVFEKHRNMETKPRKLEMRIRYCGEAGGGQPAPSSILILVSLCRSEYGEYFGVNRKDDQ